MTSPADLFLPAPAPDALAHSHALGERIAHVISEEGGWIPFSRFMELALYAPGLGYYAAGSRKIGADGDFVTAPEISPYFARCLALQVRQVLEREGGDVLELGPGTGILAADLFAELKAVGAAPRRYSLLEVSPDLRERQRERIARRHPGDLDRFEWVERLPDRVDGVVLANELLDVLPCAIVRRREGRFFERGVAITSTGFGWENRPLADGPLLRRAGSLIGTGDTEYLMEINFAAEGLVRSVAAALGRGLALFIDYGFSRSEYYHPQRVEGTLRCHYRHRVHGDPFFLPGLQDITAHVDFTAMAEAASAAGAEVVGYTTQAHFLISCGLAVLVSQEDPETTLSKAKATSGVHRLISPAEMGELYKVLAIGRGIASPLLGFQSARPLTL